MSYYSVDPDGLHGSSRQLRRTSSALQDVPGGVRQAFATIAEGCGDPGCSNLATGLAGAWLLSLGVIEGSATVLASDTADAATAYRGTEKVVMTAVGTAQ